MRQECGSCEHWCEIEGLRGVGECSALIPAWCEWLRREYESTETTPCDAKLMEANDGMSCETFEKKP